MDTPEQPNWASRWLRWTSGYQRGDRRVIGYWQRKPRPYPIEDDGPEEEQ